MIAAIESGDDAARFRAIHEAERRRTFVPERALRRALARTGDPRTAVAMAARLVGLRRDEAREAIARHVARDRPGAAEIASRLPPRYRPMIARQRAHAARETALIQAAIGGGEGAPAAVRELASFPGDTVRQVLEGLSRDWDKADAEAAAAALDAHRAAEEAAEAAARAAEAPRRARFERRAEAARRDDLVARAAAHTRAAAAARAATLAKARDASPTDRESLAAIAALAELPGADVDTLLDELSVSWDHAVRTAAEEALARRAAR